MRAREDEMIRQALLDAVSAEFDEAVREQPQAVSLSDEFLAWERDFLQDPIRGTKKTYRKRRGYQAPKLRKTACFIAVILLALGTGMFSGPYIAAVVTGWLDNDAPRTPLSYEVGIQLAGPQGSVYTSESIRTDNSVGTLWYWYQNDGTSDCVIQIYQVKIGKDQIVSEMTVPSGEDAFDTYSAPGNHEYYVRITCQDGGGACVDGRLRMEQYP